MPKKHKKKSLNQKWTLFWICIHAINLYISLKIISYFKIENNLLNIFLIGFSVTVLAKIVRIYTNNKRFVINKNLIKWSAINAFAIWLSWQIILYFNIKESLLFYLLIGLGLVITARIVRKGSKTKRFKKKRAHKKKRSSKKIRINKIERGILNAVNRERKKRKLSSLSINKYLTSAAKMHSGNMAKYGFLGHTGKDGSQPVDRVRRCGGSSSYIGENCHMMPKGRVKGIGNVRTPSQVANAMMKGWMKSPGHKRNILKSNYRKIGIGVRSSKKRKYYATQVFSS
jgi:uncharacterized protein YkwD